MRLWGLLLVVGAGARGPGGPGRRNASYDAFAAAAVRQNGCPASGNMHWNPKRRRPRYASSPTCARANWTAAAAAATDVPVVAARVAFLGDSLAWQMAMAVACAAGGGGATTVAMHGFHVVPLDRAVLTTYLGNVARASDVLVVSLGSWYAVGPDDDAPADAGATARALAACPAGVRAAVAAGEHALSRANARGAPDGRGVYALAQARRASAAARKPSSRSLRRGSFRRFP